ncbi:PREDICTED: neural cell adhesion molecule 2 isoform X1 [Polistes dominula]|uniref:Neural cell adhesion molecule 2 isoform X1 n=1 Tax=Polistes dominula TaxID=743375 RepID=A0ABM1HUA6_POLDO|nr:PREDICTED: neural cell adhesion molecule 2 isoform X1 [Polistes dominula]
MRSPIGHGTLSTSLLIFLTLLKTQTSEATPIQEESPFQSKAPVKLIWANEGDDVELPCDITPPTPNDSVNMVLWFRDSAGIPLYSLDARSGNLSDAFHWADSDDLGRRTYFQVGDGQRSKLKITKVKYKDQGLYRCRVDFVDSPTRNFRANLTLVEEPTRPVIYDAQGREVTGIGGPFLEGYGLLLTCQVSGGKPKPSVTWWKDGELLDGVVDTPTDDSLSKFTINHLFIGNITRSLWGTKLECRAQSAPMTKPIIREVPLDIYLKPAVVKITLSDKEMYAGHPIGAKCETWGSSPAARIIWRLGDEVIGDPIVSITQRSNSTVSKIVLTLNKNDDGKELTCKAENPRFPGGVLEETKILYVHYAPVLTAHLATGYILDTLREGDDLKLICNIQSNPPPTKVIWYHNDVRLEHDVSAGILISSNTLTLRVLTLDHSGEYSCEARNFVGQGRSPPILIYMKYAPRCREGYERREIMAAKREMVTIRCEIEADPDDLIRFSWSFNGTRSDVLPLPNSRVRDNGLVSLLDYTPNADTDYGTLACWASNSIGRQRLPCLFNVIPAKTPQTPMDCSLHNESTSLEVNCIPGSDGGSPQHFLLEVRSSFGNSGIVQVIPQTLQTPQSDQGVVSEVPPIYQEINPNPIFRLHDLEPGYDYTLYVYAINGRGRSDPALLKHVQVAEPIGGKLESTGIFLEDLKKAIPQVDSQSMIIVIAFIGVAALILVSIGVVIGLVICRRRSNRPVVSSPDDFTRPTYISAQRIEPRIRYTTDGRHSQRRSLYVEENRNDADILQQVEVDLQV